MAGMRFIDLVTDAEEVTQVRSIREVVKRLCNTSVAYICGLHEWPFLWTTDWFQTTAEYAAGTVTVTDESATVTGASTIFTTAMVGRKFRVSGATATYTIKAWVSATEITLDQLYEGTTAAGASYSIFKDEYLLRADVDSQKKIRQAENGVALFALSATEFDEAFPSPVGTGTPSLSVFEGRATKTYTTGTVSMSNGTRTLTGASTLWTTAEGVGKGTKLKIGSLIFTVNTVNSATQITTYEVATAAIAALTTYTAILDNYVVQLHSIPIEVLTFYYRFQRLPAVLDADNDIPDIPYPMHPLIGLAMLPFLWRSKGFTDRAIEAQAAFDKELARWQMKYSLPVIDQRHLVHPFSIRRRVSEAQWPAGTGVPLYR